MIGKQIVLIVVLILYSILVFFGVFHHEPWKDEAHPWVSAKEDSIAQIIESVRYAPVPILWTVLLMPLATLGLPYNSMGILNASIAVVSIALLLLLSKIPTILKILIPFSYYMAYEYAVIARHYILTILMLFCIASVYSKRLERPLLYALFISLLFQTNLYGSLPAGILALVFCGEVVRQKKLTLERLCAVMLMTASALFTFITYLPEGSPVYTSGPENTGSELSKIFLNTVTTSLFSRFIGINSSLLYMIIVTVTIIVFILFFLTILRNRTLLLIAGSSFLWLLVMNLFIKSGTLRHHGLFFVYLIFFLWISPRYTRSQRSVFIIQQLLYAGLSILLLFSVASTIYAYSMDYQYNFSGAADMASFIKRNNLLEKNITMFRAGDGEALLPYLDNKKFWYPELKEFTRYHINDSRAFGVPYLSFYTHSTDFTDDIYNSANEYFQGDQSVLYLLSSPIEEWRTEFKLLHSSLIERFWGNDTEQYWLYVRTP